VIAMDLIAGISAIHPLVLIASIALILVDVLLLFHALRRGMQYASAREWPRLQVHADSVDLQSVIHSREGLPTSTTRHYEAVYTFRYRVEGREYSKQTVRSVADRAEAEALKAGQTLSFIYNPRQPEQTLDMPPGPAPFMITVIGLLVVNAMGLGLISNLAAFFSGDLP